MYHLQPLSRSSDITSPATDTEAAFINIAEKNPQQQMKPELRSIDHLCLMQTTNSRFTWYNMREEKFVAIYWLVI